MSPGDYYWRLSLHSCAVLVFVCLIVVGAIDGIGWSIVNGCGGLIVSGFGLLDARTTYLTQIRLVSRCTHLAAQLAYTEAELSRVRHVNYDGGHDTY